MNVSKFNDKFNKLDGNIYTVEEEITVINGVYEAELIHDNVNVKTINIYTGSKLTGDKINTYLTSTPSLTPWKTIIKIFYTMTPLYISYETTGDTVEADDINNVQDAIVDTQNALNSETARAIDRENQIENNLNLYKTTNNAEIQGLKAKDIDLDNKKSDLLYVNGEFNNRYTKDQVFTKDEVLQKIKDLIGNAPQTLDTFKEIADALGDDPNFATTIMNALSKKVDKIDGKQLSANDYDNTEKATLADVNSKKHTHANKNIIDTITQALLDTWNSAYSHISDVVKHITQSERDKWNNGVSIANNANNSINNLQVGGRNLWLRTKDYDAVNDTIWIDNNDATRPDTSFYSVSGTYNGFGVIRICHAWTDLSQNVSIDANTSYVLSAWIKSESASALASLNCYVNTGSTITSQNFTQSQSISTAWTKYYFVFNSGSLTTSTCRFENDNNNAYLICGLKLEKGNIATDWTPAPEDTDSQISTINTTVSFISNRTASLETSVSGINANITTINSNVSSVTSAINSLQVGGRNLVISSQVRQSIGNSTLWNTTDSYFSLTALGNDSYKLQCTTSNKDGCRIVWQSVVQGNTTYTLKINNILFSNTNARGLYVKFLNSSNNIINGDGSYYNISYADTSFASNGTITKQITTPSNATNALFF
ncbi:hypothetical protein [Clostridium saccharobutylicum]|nr:hypothetical protein [Clostridium saccharobutylicum]NOV80144.1 hypothetical protein [Clostridium saccharobutylicum]